jgi:hypothetical protein
MSRAAVQARFEDRGRQVHIRGGKYIGREAWQDPDGRITAKYFPIIVRLDENGIQQEKKTKVKLSNVVEHRRVPRNRVEAAVLQHPQVEQALDRAMDLLARCQIRDSVELRHLITERMQQAIGRLDGFHYIGVTPFLDEPVEPVDDEEMVAGPNLIPA